MADPYKEFDATGRFAFNAHECDECKATTLHDLDDDCWGVSLDGQHALLLVRGNRMERGDRVVEWKGTHYYRHNDLFTLNTRIDPLSTYYVQRKVDHVIDSFEYV
jgi:hypothetical protein